MKDHQKELHPTYQMLRCELCGLVVSKYKAHEHWKAHMSAVKAGRDLKNTHACQEMVNINIDKISLLYPSREEVKDMPLYKCLKRFETEEWLEKHSVRHKTEFSCEHCGMRF